MLQVAPVKREVIDQWMVAESGLPVRVVNGTRPENVERVGQLRSWSDQDLLALRSLGRVSLGHIRSFFRLCNQIETGKQTFQNIREAVSIFLDGPELKVLSLRYGLDRKDSVASRNCATLQEIGDAEQLTRERVRQVQETAIQKLKSRLATVCLQPFYDFFADYLAAHGKSLTCADAGPLQADAVLGGWNPCGVLLVLSDLAPERVSFYHDVFSTLALDDLRQIEAQAVEVLDHEAAPVPIDRILLALPALPGLDTDVRRRQTVACLLDHCPDVAATVDNRYFLYRNGTQPFLVEIVRELERPVHYRAVTDAFNDRLKPLSRKGAGFVLDRLNENPQCTRVDRGVYDLKAV